MSVVTIILGLFKRIRLSIPFFDEFSGSFHLWQLVSLLFKLGDSFEVEEAVIAGILAAVPLVFWGVGIILAVVGYVFALKDRTFFRARNWFGFSDGAMGMSGVIYMLMVYGVKAQINGAVKAQIGISAGGGLIQVPVWPWLMAFLGILGAAVVLYLNSLSKPEMAVGGQMICEGPSDSDVQAISNAQTFPQGRRGPAVLEEASGLVLLQDMGNPENIYGCSLEVPVLIGRDAAGCNVVIPEDRSVSRQHCRLFRVGESCYVEDLQSHNHTYINGIMITGPMVLRCGDCLRLGMLDLRVIECDMNKSNS